MRTRTDRLDDDVDLVALGARAGHLFAREGVGLAAFGVAERIPLERPGGAAAAQERLAALAGPDEVGRPGSGPVAFASLAFDRDAPGELLVPRIAVGADAHGVRWLTTAGIDPADAIGQVRELLERGPAGPEPSDYRLRATMAPERWCDAVADARERIKSGALRKAVLARELLLDTDQPLDPATVLARLRSTFPSAILFRVGGFVGASPELLVSREGDVVRAHPLAGTAARHSDPALDAAAAGRLLASVKDRAEHQITIDHLLDTLLPYCSYVDAEPEPSVVSVANVHHLGTQVEGRLSDPAATVLELVAAVHPTPAVGGEPTDDALTLIAELEGFDRGPYAGPVGWVDGAGNGSFAVGIRSAFLDGRSVRLWAGNGMVADSEPEAELAETRAKFQAMLGALLRP